MPLLSCALALEANSAALNRLCKGDESTAFYDAERLYSEAYNDFARQIEATTGLHIDQLRALLDGAPPQPPVAWSFRTNAVHLDADCMEDEPDPRWAPETGSLSAADRADLRFLAWGLVAVAAFALLVWLMGWMA